MKLGFFAGLCLLLAACATAPSTSGVYISDADLKALKPGTTTLEEVEAKFGAPAKNVANSDGTTYLWYYYSKGQGSSSAEFLKRMNPFYKPVVQGADVTEYRFTFRKDRMVNYTVSQNGGTTGNAAPTQ